MYYQKAGREMISQLFQNIYFFKNSLFVRFPPQVKAGPIQFSYNKQQIISKNSQITEHEILKPSPLRRAH